MKKLFLTISALAFVAVSAFAYNPPVQGENLFFLAHPEMLTGGNSTAGGALLSVTPASTTINPALGALERRITLDLGYTAMIDSVDYVDKKYAQAFGTGIIVPTDWAAFCGEVEGIFAPFWNMDLGKSIHFKASASKQFMDALYIGVGIGVGGIWHYSSDWMLTADIGALYNFGDLGFMKNFRIAISANNLGKTFTKADNVGVDGWYNTNSFPGYPCFSTIRAGVAAELVSSEKFRLGLSLDVTTPLFCNVIFDAGLQMEICNFVKINTSWELNVREARDGCNSWLPTVGIVFNFKIGTGFLKKEDWSTSEIAPSVAWKNVDMDINMISAGAVIRVGELDTSGPDIEMD